MSKVFTEEKMSVAQRLTWTKYGMQNLTLAEILETIRTGNLMMNDPEVGAYTLCQITGAIRQADDEGMQNEWKARYLPVVTFNGVWDGSRISQYSHITALDFDKIPNESVMKDIMNNLKSYPWVAAVFRTFKQYRIKALAIHDNNDPSLHGEMYRQLMEKFDETLLDQSCIDISRKTYLVWDDQIWINPEPAPFHFVSAGRSIRKTIDLSTGYSERKFKSAKSIISILNSLWKKRHPEYWQKGQRAMSVFKCACQFCEYGVPEEMAEMFFLDGGWMSDDFDETEIHKQVTGAYRYKKNEYGSKYLF